MKISLKVESYAGTHRVVNRAGLVELKEGDIVELTNPDGSVDLYQVSCNDSIPCSGCCCLYDASKCIRWSRSDGVNTCILSYKHKGVFNLAFRDLNQVIENI
jgi:hypothetical protein